MLVHASLFELTGAEDGRGLNTAIVVDTHGEICAATRKLHIPVTAGYHEDLYFAEGSDPLPYPVHRLPIDSGELAVGLPTCWDEWFPEVARSYGDLRENAEFKYAKERQGLLMAQGAQLAEDLEKREEALKRLRELTLDQ